MVFMIKGFQLGRSERELERNAFQTRQEWPDGVALQTPTPEPRQIRCLCFWEGAAAEVLKIKAGGITGIHVKAYYLLGAVVRRVPKNAAAS